ncbi:hypothetical protein ACH5RR_005586 [Cinchona calisaya]|uniref:BTB domain-containing protein n=1 Tax=Cinchona calisaya TaxID=153742 RepID=A0ABD3ALL0_9GENT
MAANRDVDVDGEFVTIKCIDSYPVEAEGDDVEDDQAPAIVISTAEINTWDLTSILTHRIVEIRAHRNRIIEMSSYFRGLLCGSFSECSLDSVSIHWNLQSFLSVLRFIFRCSVDVTSDNFILLYEAALFFGVEMLLSHCWLWLDEVTSSKGSLPPQLRLDVLIHIWKYGLEHANDLIPQLCTSYLARNFKWAMSFNSFPDIPYHLLNASIQHPQLTIDSEKSLCDAILLWLGANIQQFGYLNTTVDGCTDMLEQVRCNLLPLWFLAGLLMKALMLSLG